MTGSCHEHHYKSSIIALNHLMENTNVLSVHFSSQCHCTSSNDNRLFHWLGSCSASKQINDTLMTLVGLQMIQYVSQCKYICNHLHHLASAMIVQDTCGVVVFLFVCLFCFMALTKTMHWRVHVEIIVMIYVSNWCILLSCVQAIIS